CFVSQRAILDRASVFITHAGFNSLLESSAATVPMLCIPLSADQPFNAANAERVGAALMLTRMTATPENVRDAVRRLLAETSFKESCRKIGAELRSLPAVENAVPLIEYLAATREPVSTMTE
ncbi:MAG TPA: nucleotide disphospho-sugar-binding domain-containing protein, partial [Actinomycetota bacterium]|nr:nucleotide disphospho-sugar-binding domain-containing protein [Actinomycetota bacterium]